ncbi:MAG TPA: recombination protein RecR [Candidatus Cloacimonetes bacterium]|nr:recombination protein RecR [Candidatus Cloacimonadota bacterium]HEX37977.1 recombination protein RecR [Candidatus Cloacimonadota bacterium]
MFEGKLEELKNGFKRLPGIGEKTAERLAFYLISQEKEVGLQLSELIRESITSIQKCESCNMLSEKSPCHFCADDQRDEKTICVVEKSQDVYLIEDTGVYKGRYFVLGNLISPLDGIGPNHINFPKLQQLVEKEDIHEIILAVNPSSAGETTISFLTASLQKDGRKITRLATGLPIGGDIEYTSKKTLASALTYRNESK